MGFEVTFGLEETTKFLSDLVHVPGLRGNPERTYATTAISGKYPGRFESYVASLISDWEINNTSNFLNLTEDLNELGLTSAIRTQKIDDTQVEIKVSRIKTNCKKKDDEHLVSIADVGFGVSQVLPILVALTAAKNGQYVIIEQPELHLHPKAQLKLAMVIVKAIKKGVKVIIETHSNILIQGMQTIVARGEIAPGDIALNWFESDNDGYTKVSVGTLNRIGAFGEWPADFMDVQLESENEYLNAVEKQMFRPKNK
jgi:predicted ATPase